MRPSRQTTLHPARSLTAEGDRGTGREARSRFSRGMLAMAAVGLVAVLAFLLLADGGQRVVRWLAPLNSYQVALIELNTASRGDGPDGQEYVVFLHDGAGPEVLALFFRDHPSVRFVSAGLIPGVAVVHIRDDIPAALAALRTQPFVRLALKSRLGMVCH